MDVWVFASKLSFFGVVRLCVIVSPYSLSGVRDLILHVHYQVVIHTDRIQVR